MKIIQARIKLVKGQFDWHEREEMRKKSIREGH